jgi:hypothetical protein
MGRLFMSSRVLRACAVAALMVGVGATAAPRATTVIAPTFSELVEQAQVVFEGETIQTQSRWATSGTHRVIRTDVTFSVVRTLKGELGTQTMLTFLGGIVGEDRMEVVGMPKFRVGDRDVLFVNADGAPSSPVVGFMHGRFRILEDPATGRQSMARFNYEPLAAVGELGTAALRSGVPSSRALTLRAFEDEITSAVRRLPARK